MITDFPDHLTAKRARKILSQYRFAPIFSVNNGIAEYWIRDGRYILLQYDVGNKPIEETKLIDVAFAYFIETETGNIELSLP